jgi:hypothetical protein
MEHGAASFVSAHQGYQDLIDQMCECLQRGHYYQLSQAQLKNPRTQIN